MILGAAALGASLVFSTAAFFLLVPLAVATLALTFGLSAGAFVIKGIAFSVFNLVSVQAEYQHTDPRNALNAQQVTFSCCGGSLSFRPGHLLTHLSMRKSCACIAARLHRHTIGDLDNLQHACCNSGGGCIAGLLHPHSQIAGLDTQRVHQYALCAARNPSTARHCPSEASVVLSVGPCSGVVSCLIVLSSRLTGSILCRLWWEARSRRDSSSQAGCWARRPGSLWTGRRALRQAAHSLAPSTLKLRCKCALSPLLSGKSPDCT